jgi:hypothetical protein
LKIKELHDYVFACENEINIAASRNFGLSEIMCLIRYERVIKYMSALKYRLNALVFLCDQELKDLGYGRYKEEARQLRQRERSLV